MAKLMNSTHYTWATSQAPFKLSSRLLVWVQGSIDIVADYQFHFFRLLMLTTDLRPSVASTSNRQLAMGNRKWGFTRIAAPPADLLSLPGAPADNKRSMQ